MMMQTQCAQKEVIEETTPEIGFQFRVFKNQKYVQLNGFKQSRVTIGRSPKADLMLDHSSVAEQHADIALKGGLFFLTNYKPNNGLRVNGQSIKKIEIKDSDVIDIGPFSIVFKPTFSDSDLLAGEDRPRVPSRPGKAPCMALMETPRLVEARSPSEQYALVLENEYADEVTRENVAKRLGIVFRETPERMMSLLQKPQQMIKKGLSYEKAFRLQQILELAGAAGSLRLLADTGPPPREMDTPAPVMAVDEEDEDEEEVAASFNLKEKLSIPEAGAGRTAQQTGDGRPQLEIIKSIGRRVVDVQFLTRGWQYRVAHASNRLRLAELSLSNKGYVSFPDTWQGYLISNGRKADLETLKTENYLQKKRGGLYRMPLALGDTVVAADGYCEYQVRHTLCCISPQIASQTKIKEITWRHWGASAGFHLLVLLIAFIAVSLSSKVSEESGLHFVKIDMSQFEKILPPQVEVKEPEKKTAPPPKIEPAKKQPEVQKAVPPPPTKTATKKSQAPSQATPKVTDGKEDAKTNSHPDAGGGFGDGNIQNRNINQTGLLSLLGDGTASSPSEAIVSVTNLDAVEVPGGAENQFTVGGIKGSLGNGKIAISSGDMVRTKGGSQVLRSVGVEGPGTVAALERGEIGNKQVKGMVTAKMTQTVSIQGGMSREMVKRVIDQHLEEIQYCYESALMENSAIMGRIVYEWKILMTGRVGEVRIVSSSVNSNLIHGCIKEAIKSWQFPKPVGSEVVVSYPFVFDLVGF